MTRMQRSVIALATAATLGLTGVTATATELQTVDYAASRTPESWPPAADKAKSNLEQLNQGFETYGKGTMPDTPAATKMAQGSISDLEMTGKDAYYGTQAAWGIVWSLISLIGVAGIYNAAQQAGLIQWSSPNKHAPPPELPPSPPDRKGQFWTGGAFYTPPRRYNSAHICPAHPHKTHRLPLKPKHAL